MSIPTTQTQGGRAVPHWVGFRNASSVRGLVPIAVETGRNTETINIGFQLPTPSGFCDEILPLVGSPPLSAASASGAVWVTATFATASNWNRTLAFEHELRRAVAHASISPGFGPWELNRTGWGALDAQGAASLALSGSPGATSAEEVLSRSLHLPVADGRCHGLEAAEIRHNLGAPSSPVFVAGASQFDSRRQAPGSVSTSLAGSGRLHFGRECWLDTRNSSDSPQYTLPPGSESIDAAFLILIPAVPHGLNLTQAELLDHAVFRPRVAGSWVWSAFAPRGWRAWPGARARVVLPPASMATLAPAQPAWGVGIVLGDEQSWPQELFRVWPGNTTAAPAAVTAQAFAESASTLMAPSSCPPAAARSSTLRLADSQGAGASLAAVAVAAGKTHSLALLEDGTVRAFGEGQHGRLGYGSTSNVGDAPASLPWQAGPVPVGGRAAAVSAGWFHSMVLLDDGTIRAFGHGDSGRLGYGSTADSGGTALTLPRLVGPVLVGGRVTAISAGGEHNLVALDDGTIRAFGAGASGQLGYGSGGNVGDSSGSLPQTAGAVSLGGRAVAICAGGSSSLALLADGTLRAFGSVHGYGTASQVGSTAGTVPSSMGPVSLGGRATACASGDEHNLVVLEDGSIRAFGWGFQGRLGYGATTNVGDSPSTLPSLAGAVALGGRAVAVAAGEHSLVVLEDGTLRAFGPGAFGRLGYGTTSDVGDTASTLPWVMGPVPVDGQVLAVAAGSEHSLVITRAGRVAAVGRISDGRLGVPSLGTTTSTAVVQPVLSGSDGVWTGRWPGVSRVEVRCTTVPASGGGVFLPARSAAAGSSHSLALLEDGSVRAFGSGTYGQLGYGSTASVGSVPTALPWAAGSVPLGGRAAAVSAGFDYSLVLLEDGSLRAFGRGLFGRLGYGASDNVGDSLATLPLQAGPVSLGGTAVAMDAGSVHSVVLLADGSVRAFGRGSSGELGYGSTSNAGTSSGTVASALGAVPLGESAVAVAAGSSHSLALLEDGTVRAFGSGSYGQLGYGSTAIVGASTTTLPRQAGAVPLGGRAVAVDAGSEHSLVVMEDGSVLAFGRGLYGRLGYGSDSDVGGDSGTTPEKTGPVPLGGRAVAVAGGDQHSLVLLESGAAVAFGYGLSGRLGYGATTNVGDTSSTLPWRVGAVPLGGRATSLAPGWQHSLVVLEDGSLRAFGSSGSGRLGSGLSTFAGETSAAWAAPTTVLQPACAVATDPCHAESRAVVSRLVTAGLSPSLPSAVSALTLPSSAAIATFPVSSNASAILVGVDLWPAPTFALPSLVYNLVTCPTGIVATDAVTGATVCGQPALSRFDAGIRLDGAALVVDSAFSSASGNLSLSPRGGTLSGMVLEITGDFAAASLLESIRDDRSDAVNRGCAREAPAPATTTVWLRGCDSVSSCWSRQIKGCVFHDTLTIRCMQTPPGHGAPGSLRVEVRATTPQVNATAVLQPLALGFAAPVIEAVIPSASLSTGGGETVIIQGSGFGAGDAEIPSVAFEGIGPCHSVVRESDVRLRCVSPAGVGQGISVSVSAGGQTARSSASSLTTSYGAPRITSVRPGHLLAGARNATVAVEGVNLALRQEDVTEFVLGGFGTCRSVRVVAVGTSLECLGVDAPSREWPSPGQANISIAGQSSGSTLGLFQGIDAPDIDAVVVLGEQQAATSGGRVRIVGTGFGLSQADVGGVWFGGTRGDACSLTDALAGFIECIVPRGAGSVPVRVVSAASASSVVTATSSMTYGAPVVTACSPPFLLPGRHGGPWNLTIRGTGFDSGSNQSFASIASVTVGGLLCASPTLDANGTEIVCPGPASWVGTGVDAFWPQADDPVRVVVGGLSSGRVGTAVLALASPPQILRVVTAAASATATFPTVGKLRLAAVTGGSLVAGNASLANLTVVTASRTQLVQFSVMTASRLEFELPAGVGSASLVMTTARGMAATLAVVYDPPAVGSVDPPFLLAGGPSGEVVIRGTNLGLTESDFDSITMAGVACRSVTVVDPGRAVRCSGIDTSATNAWPDPATPVSVRVGGQSSPLVAASVFEAVGAPFVALVTPTTVEQGDRLTISAAGIGRSAGDISRVVLGGTVAVDCDELQWVSTTSLSCRVPVNHPLWQRPIPGADDPVELLHVIIENRYGALSAPFALAPRDRASQLSPVAVQPWDVRARRPLGVFTTLQMQWRYLSSAEEDRLRAASSAEPATAFTIEVIESTAASPTQGRRRGLQSAGSTVTVLSSTMVDRLGSEVTGAFQLTGFNSSVSSLFRTEVTITVATPVQVRVRASNDFGTGPASALSSFAVEACTSTQFLDARGAVDTWQCAACPDEAVCAGLPSSNVTARAGFWRLPWASLKFASCSPPSACKGAPADFGGANTTDLLAPTTQSATEQQVSQLQFKPAQAAPGVSLAPGRMEVCGTLRHGILCSSCVAGSYKLPGSAECVSCGDVAGAWARSVGIGTLMLAVITWMIWRAAMAAVAETTAPATAAAAAKVASTPAPSADDDDQEAASLIVQTAKMVLTHFQTVTIVAGVQLQWPEGVTGMFSFAQVGSSFSSQGMSLECLLGQQDAVTRTLVTLGGSLALVVYVLVLWAVILQVQGMACCTQGSPGSAAIQGGSASSAPRSLTSSSGAAVAAVTPMSVTTGNRGSGGKVVQASSVHIVSPMAAHFQALPSSIQAPPSSIQAPPSSIQAPKPSSSLPALPDPAQSRDWSAAFAAWGQRVGPSMLVLAFLLHPGVAESALRLLACQLVGPEGDVGRIEGLTQSRLVMDLEIQCNDPAWTAARLGVALPVLLLFSLGLPAGSAWALWMRRQRLSEPAVHGVFGFLYEGFDPKRAYAWESVIMCRKLAIAVVTVVLSASGATTQAAAGTFVVVGFCSLHAWVKPYSSAAINRLEMTSLLVAGVTLFCANLMGIEKELTRGEGAVIVTLVIVGSNAAFLALAVVPAASAGTKAFLRHRAAAAAVAQIAASASSAPLKTGSATLAPLVTARAPSSAAPALPSTVVASLVPVAAATPPPASSPAAAHWDSAKPAAST